MRFRMKWLLTVCGLALTGCAGTQFVRPDADGLKNGQTTYARVLEMMGTPRSQGEAMKNNKRVKAINYVYAEAGGKSIADDVIAGRSQVFYFLDDRLVGHFYLSTWAEDATRFDDGKLDALIKGKTTKTEVIDLLGKPSGYFIHPMIEPATGEALVYSYTQVSRAGLFKMNVSNKQAIITVDDRGVVSNVDYTSVSPQ